MLPGAELHGNLETAVGIGGGGLPLQRRDAAELYDEPGGVVADHLALEGPFVRPFLDAGKIDNPRRKVDAGRVARRRQRLGRQTGPESQADDVK